MSGTWWMRSYETKFYEIFMSNLFHKLPLLKNVPFGVLQFKFTHFRPIGIYFKILN